MACGMCRLRLKANTIQAGTVSYPDEAIVAVAARRGLVLTASHFNLVGSNTYRWPLELSALPNQGWDWRRDPQSMAHLWRASIDAQKELGEVLWSVGLRGVTDSDYTACGTNKTICAEITNEVVSNMTSWIRDAQGSDAPIIWFLFGGAAELMMSGLLRPPYGVIFLASDNYPHIGEINTVPPNLTSGVYYHAAWMSTYTSQLAEMVPPALFYSQLEKYRKNAKSTDVFVLNVSDLLPVLMAAELIMKYLWSRVELEQAPSIAVAQSQALTAWAAREVGFHELHGLLRLHSDLFTVDLPSSSICTASHTMPFVTDRRQLRCAQYTDGNQTLAAEVTTLLERYYGLVLVPSGKTWTPLNGDTTVGDVWLANLTRALSWCAMNVLPEADRHCDMTHLTTESIASIAKQVRTSPVVPLLSVLDADTERLASRLDAVGSSGASFFRASVGLRHSMFANLWIAAVAAANAIESYTHSTRSVSARQDSVSGNVSLAESAFQRIFAYQRTAEAATGFRGMYANDKLSDLHRSRRVVRQLGVFLLNLLEPKSPGLVVLEDTGGSLYQFYDYQLEHQRSYPLLHKSSRWNLYRLVRVSCALSQTTSSDCQTSADGGRFRGTIHIQMEAIDQCPIRFEMAEGTQPPPKPTPDSKLYTGPILLSATTSFRAALACGNESENVWLVSSLTFTTDAQQSLKSDDLTRDDSTLRSESSSWSGPNAIVRRQNGHVELLIDGKPSVPIWFKNHASASGSSEFWATVQYELRLAAGAGVPVISFVLACTETASCATDGKLDPTVAKMVTEADQASAAANSSHKALLWPTVFPHWPDAEPVLTSDATSSKTSKEYGNTPSFSWRNKTAAAVATWMQALDKAYPGRVLGVHLAGLQTTVSNFRLCSACLCASVCPPKVNRPVSEPDTALIY